MEISLYDYCAQSDFLRKPVGACSHLSYISLASICSQEMADLEVQSRQPKKAGGRTKIHNNCEGLSEDVIIAKNLRTPEGSE